MMDLAESGIMLWAILHPLDSSQRKINTGRWIWRCVLMFSHVAPLCILNTKTLSKVPVGKTSPQEAFCIWALWGDPGVSLHLHKSLGYTVLLKQRWWIRQLNQILLTVHWVFFELISLEERCNIILMYTRTSSFHHNNKWPVFRKFLDLSRSTKLLLRALQSLQLWYTTRVCSVMDDFVVTHRVSIVGPMYDAMYSTA